MECTQRLECTQELYSTQTEKTNPEQIGFLGICGQKYPVNRGPNKIGRDPQTCSIVLNLNSISRQHAVINVLNQREFMLMDLDSANKTKLLGKTLQPFIPNPLKDGDTVQFGDIFGVFRLLEVDNDLPMTQAIDIPDTPVFSRHTSRIHNAVTTIPESPDVSDRDDSFIIPSQPKANKFKSPSNKFIKQSSKTISIQPIGSNKIDNIYWNSSKKSTSLHLDDSNTSLNDSVRSESDKTIENQSVNNDIHEMETQPPLLNDSTDSIYTAATQVPEGCDLSIHNLDTQLPTTEHLPLVRKINDQHEMQFDLYAANKENDISIYNAETQIVTGDIDKNKDKNIFEADTQMATVIKLEDEDAAPNDSIFDAKTQLVTADTKRTSVESKNSSKNKSKSFVSDDEIFFDEVDSQPILDDIYSQPLLPQETSPNKANDDDGEPLELSQRVVEDIRKDTKPQKRNVRITSDSSTDCDDDYLLPTQKNTTDGENLPDEGILLVSVARKSKKNIISNPESKEIDKSDKKILKPRKRNVRITSDSSTDCEDFDMLPIQKIPTKPVEDDTPTDCEDDSIDDAKKEPNKALVENPEVSFDEMATQVIPYEVTNTHNNLNVIPDIDTKFEDMLTQVIPENKEVDFEDLPTQVLVEVDPKPKVIDEEKFSEEIVSFFKVPLQTPRKSKKKEIVTPLDNVPIKQKSPLVKPSISNIDEKYYAATQDIVEDLCSQRELSPEVVMTVSTKLKESYSKHDNKVPLQPPKISKKKEMAAADVLIKQKSPLVKPSTSNIDTKYYAATQDILEDLCSQRELSPEITTTVNTKPKENDSKHNMSTKHQHEMSPKKKFFDKLSDSYGEENVNKYVTSLSSKQIRTVIGVDSPVDTVRKVPSDPSDLEVTPKKVRPFKLMLTELPDSQEIKTSVTITSRSLVTESSSDSEVENDSQDNTPILFRNRKKSKKLDAKKDLSKNFDAQTLPSRIITRLRKPTSRFQDGEKNIKNKNENILKSKLFTDQESDVNKDIITENISRLKTKKDKKNNKDTTVDLTKLEEEKKESKTRTKSKDEVIIELKDSPQKVTERPKVSEEKKKSTDEIKSKTSKNKSNEEKEPSKKSKKTETDKSNDKEVRKESKSIKDAKSKRKEVAKTSKSSEPTNNSTVSEPNTRTRRSNRDDQKQRSVSPEKEVKRKRGRPKLAETEDEPRRSRRKKETNDKKEIISIKKHEQSTVYNLSTESKDSPKTLKRSAVSDIEVPSPKRTRSALSRSLRATPARTQQTHYVLFTAFPCDEVRVKLEKLGAVIVTDVTACTVVLTLQIKRTFKLLCAVGLGKPIVGPDWVQACVDTNIIVDPWLYLMKDEANEKRFQFSLAKTLNGKRQFLQGYNVSSTPKVMPSASEMKLIVESSGGTWKERGPRWVCVSCAADAALWPALRQRGAVIVSTEFILSGVLKQQLDIDRNRLDK